MVHTARGPCKAGCELPRLDLVQAMLDFSLFVVVLDELVDLVLDVAIVVAAARCHDGSSITTVAKLIQGLGGKNATSLAQGIKALVVHVLGKKGEDSSRLRDV